MTSESTVLRTIVIVLAFIGLLSVIAMLGMWLMHGSMRGMMGMGETAQKMASLCHSLMAARHS